MNKYRKKPLIIEAEQMDVPFEIETLEGKMTGEAGDYLVTGTQGEQYPVKEHIFKAIYDLVEEE